MAKMQQEMFGGEWTERKLRSLEKYLEAYLKVFRRNSRAAFFTITYVDAFAGTGYMHQPEMPLATLFPEVFAELLADANKYIRGSAVRALEIDPGFDRYLFIERSRELAEQLTVLKARYPTKCQKIQIVVEDANVALKRWISEVPWDKNRDRAVVFLDPFGMQVEWSTIQALASTKAVDLWILFPLFGVNRMLPRSGNLPESWRSRLSLAFGTDSWETEFYYTQTSTFFEGVKVVHKVADEKRIASYFVDRLRSIFPAVAPPLILPNSKGRPLFLLCFAAANERGAPIALRIAKNILEKS
jgi:three-Cys-motif partner protein